MKLTINLFLSIVWLTSMSTMLYFEIGKKPDSEYCDNVHTWYDVIVVFLTLLFIWGLGFMSGRESFKTKM